MTSNTARGVGTTPSFVFGVVLKGLEQYRELVHLLATSPLVAIADFAYAAPIYKGSDAIKAALARAESALEKFDVYFQHALLDEQERVRFARLFAQAYLKRYPASERSDLFVASGDVMKFSFELVPPMALEDPNTALSAIEQTPHDAEVLAALRAGGHIDRAHYRADIKLFLDHALNPRRHEVPRVQRAAAELGTDLPYVVELVTDGAIPGYVYYAVSPLVHQAGGRLVLLPG
jgi:hypothetical protein